MPFIGQEPQIGAYHVLDSITASATATYNLQLNGGAFSPASANHLLVSLNGVLQKPGASFNVSGSQITFSSALTSSDNINFIMALGNVLDVGTPTDGTVNAGKLAANAVTTAKIADDAVTGAKIEDNPTIAGQLSEAGKEYFKIVLSTDMTGLADVSSNVVDYASNGTIKHDTKSKWDASNNAYEFDSATGLYLITMSAGIRSNTVQTESLYDVYSRVQFSADNFSSTITNEDIEFGASSRPTDSASHMQGSVTFFQQSIYKNTAAGRKIRHQVYANTNSTTYAISSNANVNAAGTFGAASKITRLEVLRIG